MSKVWLIASGKGGVGKSTLAANLGIALSKRGQRSCIIDADIGLRDQDVILGVQNRIIYDIVDVANKQCRLSQALISPEEESNLSLLPASQFARVKELDPKALKKIMAELRQSFDHILIDCPAGVERGLRTMMKGDVDEVLLVCTPDDVCIRNAERVASLMDGKHMPRPLLIVNRLNAELIHAGEMYSAQVVAETLDLTLFGEVPDDPAVYRALLTHQAVIHLDCEAQQAITRISQRMLNEEIPLPAYGSVPLKWYQKLFLPKLKEVKKIAH